MLSGSIEPIDLDVAAIINEELSPKARSTALATVARQTLAEALNLDLSVLGYLPAVITIVDGVLGALEVYVKPEGEIDYQFQIIGDVLDWIREQLEAHSPVGVQDSHPGLYKSSHRLFADGQEVQTGHPAPVAGEYVFFNIQPYSRAIERGESSQAPTGVYEAVAVLAQQRFGNQARISFSFLAPPAGAILDWAATSSAATLARRRGGRRELHQEWLTRVPAITVTI